MTEKRANPLLDDDIYLYDCGHGGGCCGITHLWEFPHLNDIIDDGYRKPTVAERTEFILKAVEGSTTYQHCYEIVLADYQMKDWQSAVKAAGFRRVGRFLNSNSSNFCNIFHKYTNQPAKAK